jgi:hypothetical protein
LAGIAGGEWPRRALEAARALSGGGAVENQTFGVMLLADLREMFYPKTAPEVRTAPKIDVLFTKEILTDLHKRDDRSWSEWGKSGKPMTAPQLAALLKPFGIKTNKTVRRGDATDKGYRRKALEDAFLRYLPPLTSFSEVTESQVAVSATLDEFSSVTPHRNVTDEILKKPSVPAGCDRVTAATPASGGKHANGAVSDEPDPAPVGCEIEGHADGDGNSRDASVELALGEGLEPQPVSADRPKRNRVTL